LGKKKKLDKEIFNPARLYNKESTGTRTTRKGVKTSVVDP
jgi:hypothetical protein